MQSNHHITLAVFPFEDLSSPNDPGIFSRSFSEDLITELSRFRQLSVVRANGNIASSDSQRITDTSANTYYVQGTFRADKKMLKINVQLYERDSRRLDQHATHTSLSN